LGQRILHQKLMKLYVYRFVSTECLARLPDRVWRRWPGWSQTWVLLIHQLKQISQLVADKMTVALISNNLSTRTQLLRHMNGENLVLPVVRQNSLSAISEHKYYTPHVCHHWKITEDMICTFHPLCLYYSYECFETAEYCLHWISDK